MRTKEWGNPFFNEDIVMGRRSRSSAGTMTVAGVLVWLVIHLAIVTATGAFTWHKAMQAYRGFDFTTLEMVDTSQKDSDGDAIKQQVVIDRATGKTSPVPNFDLSQVHKLMWLGVIGGLICGMVGIFCKSGIYLFGPLYAAFEGLALGGISAGYEIEFHGIAMQSVALTFAVLVAMSLLFAFRIIRPTGPFVAGLLACMLGILLVYLVDILLGFAGRNLGIVHSNGWMGIGFSLFVCAIAAFNFIVDFDTIEKGVENGAPRYMEAYCAFSVLITLIWLYLEILRLLAKFKSKD